MTVAVLPGCKVLVDDVNMPWVVTPGDEALERELGCAVKARVVSAREKAAQENALAS